MTERLGAKTVTFAQPPVITGHAGVVGKKEGEGPLGQEFDHIFEDTTMGDLSWEQAESAILHDCLERALAKAGRKAEDCDFVLCGDLLDQCTGSAFALKDLHIPFLGMYGACSTMALTTANAAMLISGGAASTCLCATSSHFAASERQFRFPLEYGGQRPPTSQWTVTGAGGLVLESSGSGAVVEAVHIGTIADKDITDANNMGAAMAPAAKETIAQFLRDTDTEPEDYDMILTGDLGLVGSRLLRELLVQEEGIDLKTRHQDCGLLMFNLEEQDVNAGGSGCGCSASILCSHVLNQMKAGKLSRVMFVATGALLSSTSAKQGQPIPGIAHGIIISNQG